MKVGELNGTKDKLKFCNNTVTSALERDNPSVLEREICMLSCKSALAKLPNNYRPPSPVTSRCLSVWIGAFPVPGGVPRDCMLLSNKQICIESNLISTHKTHY